MREKTGVTSYLATAKFSMDGRDNRVNHTARGLFDSGAQTNLVTEKLVKKLKCRREKAECPYLIKGVKPGKQIYADTYAILKLRNRKTGCWETIKALILKQDSWTLGVPYPPAPWLVRLQRNLADPEVLQRRQVNLEFDMILSTSLCVQYLGDIVYKHGAFQIKDSPFGWVLEGESPDPGQELPQNKHHMLNDALGLRPTENDYTRR